MTALRERAGHLLESARERLQQSKENVKEKFDRLSRPKDFKPGDMVWITREVRDRASGLYTPYEGPYEVIDKLSDVNYKIRKNGKDLVIHANRMKFANINLSQGNPVPGHTRSTD